VSQEESEHNEVDRMKEGVDSTGDLMHINPVWHRMLYSCTHMATVSVKGLTTCCRSYGLEATLELRHQRVADVACLTLVLLLIPLGCVHK